MSAIFTKYPLAEKALEEQEGIARFLGGEPSALFRQMAENYARTADAYTDEAHEDKEAMIVGCILMSGSPFAFDDITRFSTEYTPQVEAMVNTILRLDERAIRTNPVMQQTLAVMGLCHNQAVIDIIENSDELPPDLQFITKADIWQPQHFPLLEESAPRLYTAFEKKCDALLAARDAHGGPDLNIAPFKPRGFDF